MTFTEPLERASSRATLLEVSGQQMPEAIVRAGADEYAMVLALPSSLPNGTCTVAWEPVTTLAGAAGAGR